MKKRQVIGVILTEQVEESLFECMRSLESVCDSFLVGYSEGFAPDSNGQECYVSIEWKGSYATAMNELIVHLPEKCIALRLDDDERFYCSPRVNAREEIYKLLAEHDYYTLLRFNLRSHLRSRVDWSARIWNHQQTIRFQGVVAETLWDGKLDRRVTRRIAPLVNEPMVIFHHDDPGRDTKRIGYEKLGKAEPDNLRLRIADAIIEYFDSQFTISNQMNEMFAGDPYRVCHRLQDVGGGIYHLLFHYLFDQHPRSTDRERLKEFSRIFIGFFPESILAHLAAARLNCFLDSKPESIQIYRDLIDETIRGKALCAAVSIEFLEWMLNETFTRDSQFHGCLSQEKVYDRRIGKLLKHYDKSWDTIPFKDLETALAVGESHFAHYGLSRYLEADNV